METHVKRNRVELKVIPLVRPPPRHHTHTHTQITGCVKFGENRRRNATVRVSTDGHTRTHARTDSKRFYLSHAICYSYGADKKRPQKMMHECHVGACSMLPVQCTLIAVNKCYISSGMEMR